MRLEHDFTTQARQTIGLCGLPGPRLSGAPPGSAVGWNMSEAHVRVACALDGQPESLRRTPLRKGNSRARYVILDSFAEGAERGEILKSYPSLSPEHLDAALAYAAELAREEALIPLRSE